MRKLLGLILALFICIQGWSVNSLSASMTSIKDNNFDSITTSKDSNPDTQIHPWQLSSMVTSKVRTGDRGATDPEYKIWLPLVFIPPIYYVSTTGNDANPGTLYQPWLTIQKAANTMVAGDTLIVMAGNYSTQRVKITKSGVSGSPIIYQAQGQVIMKGFDILASYVIIDGFEVANTNYVRWNCEISTGICVYGAHNIIENNYIHDAALRGINLRGDVNDDTSHDNIVRNNKLYRNEYDGIIVNGKSNLIEGNEIWDTVECHPNVTVIENAAPDNKGKKCPNYPAIDLDANGITFFGSGHIIRRNYIHDILFGPPGINPAIGDYNDDPHIDCFQTSEGNGEVASNILFEQNYCDNLQFYAAGKAPATGFMLGGGANNLTIRNNIVRAYGGVNTGPWDNANHLYIYNNVWVCDLSFGVYSGFGIALTNSPHSIVENNIFYDQAYVAVYTTGDATGDFMDYNLAYNSDGSTPSTATWGTYRPWKNSHNLWKIDPKFISTTDYHLQASSPAIDAGYNLGNLVPNDFDGVIRPQGAGFDIGAYEFPAP